MDPNKMNDYDVGPGCRPDPEFTLQLVGAVLTALARGFVAVARRVIPVGAR